MALIKHKLAAATAVAAAFSLVAAPAAAVELPRAAGQQEVKAGTLDVENRRYRGYRGHRGYRDRNDIDAGDVLTGVLILGGIAAIASAAGKQRQVERYPAEQSRDWDDDAGYTAPSSDDATGGGLGRAVDKCVAEIEAGVGAVRNVEAAGRDANGWRVSGQLEDGTGYWCTVDDAGRVSGVGGSGTAYAEPVEDGQYDDAYYAGARAQKAQLGGGYEVAAAE